MYVLTIIIPTRNEARNIHPLLKQIQQCMYEIRYEIIFVDDSDDQTPKVIESLQEKDSRIRLLHRPKETRNGLAGAVVDGLHLAHSPIVAVMDADLQHPPSVLPQMVERIMDGADFIIGSRYVQGGSDGGLKGIRKVVSWTARFIARVFLPQLRTVTDCTSGYFAFLNNVSPLKLSPVGWKIMIEVLIKGNFKRVEEVPIHFEERVFEQSKMSITQQINFLRHVALLARESPWSKYVRFAVVGLVGVAVNQILLYVLLSTLTPLDASISASLGAMVVNYALNSRWTWKTRQKHGVYALGVSVLYFGISILGILTTSGVFEALQRVGLGVGLSQLVGIGLTSVWTFTAHNSVTFRGASHHVKSIKAK